MYALFHHRRFNFNPRSPHGERQIFRDLRHFTSSFQSTLPARGATRFRLIVSYALKFQSTLPARGATIPARPCRKWGGNFNPRSPHGERRLPLTGLLLGYKFQSTLPARGATALLLLRYLIQLISIHAPRTGSDKCHRLHPYAMTYFNPRSPHGERPKEGRDGTLPLVNFNPRSPHGERLLIFLIVSVSCYFNPRSPHGERQRCPRIAGFGIVISIHAPRTGSDKHNSW